MIGASKTSFPGMNGTRVLWTWADGDYTQPPTEEVLGRSKYHWKIQHCHKGNYVFMTANRDGEYSSSYSVATGDFLIRNSNSLTYRILDYAESAGVTVMRAFMTRASYVCSLRSSLLNVPWNIIPGSNMVHLPTLEFTNEVHFIGATGDNSFFLYGVNKYLTNAGFTSAGMRRETNRAGYIAST